jgi:ABC-type multidrug transport system fused ATPase/permease subunit
VDKYLTIINFRTALAVGVAALTTYITLTQNFQYNFDLTMISIAIIFPLVFTIRSAFRRREKALEYLSRFKAGLITVDACFQENRKISPEQKEEVGSLVRNISNSLINYLGPETCSQEKLNEEAGKVALFIRNNSDHIGNATALKIYRFMKDVYQGIENVVAIKHHRTPISIRAYCLIFIYVYPVIYTPSLYNRLHEGISFNQSWILYTLSMFSTFILISLYNVQEQLENPFDQHGVDDIRLVDFKIN